MGIPEIPNPDPFREARQKHGMMACPFQGETVPMILRHADVRQAARDWQTFSSDAPFRVPIPSEEDAPSMRQLPIETNPPGHTEYREIVEPFFARTKDPAVMAKVDALVAGSPADATKREPVEVVREFALPLQSRALTHLLHVTAKEAETWMAWGIHVFRDGWDGQKMGAALEADLHQQFDRAETHPGEVSESLCLGSVGFVVFSSAS